MKAITIKLLGWLLSQSIIEQLFEKQVPKKFRIVNQKEVNVKKGKRRYTLLITETNNPAAKVIWNLNRH